MLQRVASVVGGILGAIIAVIGFFPLAWLIWFGLGGELLGETIANFVTAIVWATFFVLMTWAGAHFGKKLGQ
jgi:hypothetical protein